MHVHACSNLKSFAFDGSRLSLVGLQALHKAMRVNKTLTDLQVKKKKAGHARTHIHNTARKTQTILKQYIAYHAARCLGFVAAT